MVDIAYQPKHFNPGEAPPSRGGGVLTAYGHPGVGKTWFGVNTWDVADTLFFANFDRDASHLIKKYQGKGGVYYEDFTALTQRDANTCLDRLEGMKNAAMSQGNGVFLLDNFAACYEIATLAKYDEKKSGALSYGPINTWLRDFCKSLERAGIWAILTAPSKEIWVSVENPNTGRRTGQATGTFDPDGWKHADYHIMGEVWLYTNRTLGAAPDIAFSPIDPSTPDVGMDLLQKPLEFGGRIMYAKKRTAVEGMVIKNPTLGRVLKIMKEIP